MEAASSLGHLHPRPREALSPDEGPGHPGGEEAGGVPLRSSRGRILHCPWQDRRWRLKAWMTQM